MQRDAIELFRNECDEFECSETEVYWLSQSKQSESKFSNVVFERKLKTRTTFRRASMLVRFAEHLRSAEWRLVLRHNLTLGSAGVRWHAFDAAETGR